VCVFLFDRSVRRSLQGAAYISTRRPICMLSFTPFHSQSVRRSLQRAAKAWVNPNVCGVCVWRVLLLSMCRVCISLLTVMRRSLQRAAQASVYTPADSHPPIHTCLFTESCAARYNERLKLLHAAAGQSAADCLFLSKIESSLQIVSHFEALRNPLKALFRYISNRQISIARQFYATGEKLSSSSSSSIYMYIYIITSRRCATRSRRSSDIFPIDRFPLRDSSTPRVRTTIIYIPISI